MQRPAKNGPVLEEEGAGHWRLGREHTSDHACFEVPKDVSQYASPPSHPYRTSHAAARCRLSFLVPLPDLGADFLERFGQFMLGAIESKSNVWEARLVHIALRAL